MLLLARIVRTMQPINLLTEAILEKTAVLVVVATVVQFLYSKTAVVTVVQLNLMVEALVYNISGSNSSSVCLTFRTCRTGSRL